MCFHKALIFSPCKSQLCKLYIRMCVSCRNISWNCNYVAKIPLKRGFRKSCTCECFLPTVWDECIPPYKDHCCAWACGPVGSATQAWVCTVRGFNTGYLFLFVPGGLLLGRGLNCSNVHVWSKRPQDGPQISLWKLTQYIQITADWKTSSIQTQPLTARKTLLA